MYTCCSQCWQDLDSLKIILMLAKNECDSRFSSMCSSKQNEQLYKKRAKILLLYKIFGVGKKTEVIEQKNLI